MKAHPNVYEFIMHLKQELQLEQVLAGREPRLQTKVQKSTNKRLHTLHCRLNEKGDSLLDDDILEFLRGCAHNIKIVNLQ